MASCSICTRPEARALIDGALLAGNRPIDAHRYHGEALGLSLSAVYRHARAHRPGSTLAASWLGDTTSGELVADLAAQRRSHTEQRERALKRGDTTAATREGHEAAALGLALLKVGIETDATAAALLNADRLTRATQRAARNRPGHARELSAAALELRFEDLADDAEALAVSAENFHRNNKETP